MAAQLFVIAGPDRGRVLPVPEGVPLLIGRGRQTGTRLNDRHVSRVHCQIDVHNGQSVLTDLQSHSGTFVNDQRVTAHRLQAGDIIRIGETLLRFAEEDIADLMTLPPEAPPPLRAAATVLEALPSLPPAKIEPPTTPYEKPAPPPVPVARLTKRPQAPGKVVALPAARMGELTGTVLAHYDVGEELAKGKTGVVFRARDLRKGNRVVALKVLRPEFACDGKAIQRFIRSMRTMLPLRHPNLVTLYNAGKKGPYCWIAMEFVAGESLAQVIRRIGVAGMLDWRHAFRVAMDVGQALDYAHARHIIHRNITPQNVLIQESDRRARLGDLMLAKAFQGALAVDITRSNEVVGDLLYLSPEQTRGPDEVDGRSDLYSLGALVYALLTGQPPFEGVSLVETIMKIRQAKVEPPRKFQMSIPEVFEGIVLRLLAKRPEDRYPTAAALLQDLERMAKYVK
jgi:hypothetical protein